MSVPSKLRQAQTPHSSSFFPRWCHNQTLHFLPSLFLPARLHSTSMLHGALTVMRNGMIPAPARPLRPNPAPCCFLHLSPATTTIFFPPCLIASRSGEM
ncbi:hypothetical protein IF1G_06826 [Cordyceps javanica]|uniref:Uncharacterized protein n=1 Tax=Cordyceps javanica TaxID=43265 RepID=A0A545VYB3_9HYPO|nr:hypothetical protein IF1G_06826 [Cordyceps javanica]TQW06686.1 hypothetical protein IF2G_06108 [Cordyceps javanica]